MRFWGHILVFWLWVLAPAFAISAADAMLSEVSSALAAGKYEEVVGVASSGLAEPGVADLTRSRLLIVRGLARQALGENDEALADFTLGLSISSLPPLERAKALFARGVSLDSMNRLTDAAGDYGAALRLAPGAASALNNRANVYRRQGRLNDAKRDYVAALKQATPNPQYPYYGLGQIAETEGDADAARGYYSKALAAAPGFDLALERLQGMGAPAEGPAGLPANTGVIVLKPPGSGSAAPVVLHPPHEKAAGPAAASARRSRAAPGSPSEKGAPLRPAIVEGASSGARVQLGAWRSEQEARDGWAAAWNGAGGLLDRLSPVIVRTEVPGRGVFYRLRVGSPGPRGAFCSALARQGQACIPVRD